MESDECGCLPDNAESSVADRPVGLDILGGYHLVVRYRYSRRQNSVLGGSWGRRPLESHHLSGVPVAYQRHYP